MGKATRRRKAHQKDILVTLSYENRPVFFEQWDMRLESWLIEVRKLSTRWHHDQETKKGAFEILDNAFTLLSHCEPKAAASVEKRTYNELCNACCWAVAGVVNPDIYRLSNFNKFKYKSKKGRGPYGIES